MDWRKMAIARLREYPERMMSITNLKEQIEALALQQTAIRAARTDGEAVSGSNGSRREDAMIAAIVRLDALRTNLTIAKHEAAVTQRGLNGLTDEDRQLLELFYIKRWSPDEICEQLHVSRPTMYYRRDRALRQFTLASFGVVDI